MGDSLKKIKLVRVLNNDWERRMFYVGQSVKSDKANRDLNRVKIGTCRYPRKEHCDQGKR